MQRFTRPLTLLTVLAAASGVVTVTSASALAAPAAQHRAADRASCQKALEDLRSSLGAFAGSVDGETQEAVRREIDGAIAKLQAGQHPTYKDEETLVTLLAKAAEQLTPEQTTQVIELTDPVVAECTPLRVDDAPGT